MFPVYRWLYRVVGFSRSQSNGFLVLMPLLMILLFSEPLFRFFFPTDPLNFSQQRELDSLAGLFKARVTKPLTSDTDSVPKFFYFDPNTATESELQRLGLKKNVALRIIKYRTYHKFKHADELAKVYGMDSALLKQLKPFIILQPVEKIAKSPGRVNYADNVERLISFDINTVDTTQLKAIRGIGEKLSLRIIKYRDALGGFCKKEQLREVYRLDTAVAMQLMKICFVKSDFRPTQLNVNEATVEQLAGHPYISFQTAKRLVAYRIKHGKFKSVLEISKVEAFDSSVFENLKPYLLVTVE